MNVFRPFRFLLAAILLVSPAFAHHLAVVVDKDNNTGSVTSANLSKIFKSEMKKWPDGKNIVLVLHKDSVGEKQTLQRLNRLSPAELNALIAAHKDSIVLVDTDADLLKTVQATPGAIGLIDVRSISSQVNVLKVDGKLPLQDGYLPH